MQVVFNTGLTVFLSRVKGERMDLLDPMDRKVRRVKKGPQVSQVCSVRGVC